MSKNTSKEFPDLLSKPAQRALAGAGISRLEQLSGMSKAKLAALHAMGPNTISMITQALGEKGLTFSQQK